MDTGQLAVPDFVPKKKWSMTDPLWTLVSLMERWFIEENKELTTLNADLRTRNSQAVREIRMWRNRWNTAANRIHTLERNMEAARLMENELYRRIYTLEAHILEIESDVDLLSDTTTIRGHDTDSDDSSTMSIEVLEE